MSNLADVEALEDSAQDARVPSSTSDLAEEIRPMPSSEEIKKSPPTMRETRLSRRNSASAARAKQEDKTSKKVESQSKKKDQTKEHQAGASSSQPRKHGAQLIGELIKVEWKTDKAFYEALVVGFRKRKKLHLLFYVADSSVDEVNLSRETWEITDASTRPRPGPRKIGSRVLMKWNPEDLDTPERKGKKEGPMVAIFDAFIVEQTSVDLHKVIIPNTGELREANLLDKAYETTDAEIGRMAPSGVRTWR